MVTPQRSRYFCVIVSLFCLLAAKAQPTNTVVRFEFQGGTNAIGGFNVELFDQEKPETVRNFLLYLRSGAYSNSFLHRLVPGFVVQGGGFRVTNALSGSSFSSYLEVTNFGRVINEFSTPTVRSNTFGTIAMAKLGDDPNSATSQWFFNLADNPNLDTQNGGFTVFGRILPDSNVSNVLARFNTLSTNSGIINLRNLLGSTYATFGEIPVTFTNTVSRVPQYRELYYVNISELNYTNTPGSTPPQIRILAPPPFSSFTNQSVTISGTAQDDTGVARVVYRSQDGIARGVSGATNWSLSISPQAGLNTYTVESIDWEGNRSQPASVTFLYVAQVRLDLQISGSGTVEGAANGDFLQLGGFRTLTAVPAPGNIFHSWSGAVTSDLPTITFQVPTNATNFTLTAKFVTEPLPRLVGTYVGLFQSSGTPDAANSGSIALNLDAAGMYDGTIQHREGSYRFAGRFDANGHSVIQGEVGGISRTFTLELQKLDEAGLITGAIPGSATVRLERLAPGLPNGTNIVVGNQTFAITPSANPSDELAPGGYGFGRSTINSAGLLTLDGTLGDGNTFSSTAPLTRLDRWPVYVSLQGGRGVLLGWLGVATNEPNRLDGTLHWIKGLNALDPTYPAGFSNQVVFLASSYKPPRPGERLIDWAHGLATIKGPFQIAVSNLVRLTPDNHLVSLSPEQSATWNLDPVTGAVTGTFVDPWTGNTRALTGIVLKRTHSILGQFTDRRTVGNFTIGRSPFLLTQEVAQVTLPGILSALREGGHLKFTTNVSVTFTQPFTIPYDTFLDANGHSVTFSGGEATRLFTVPTNKIFSAKGVVFADAKVVGGTGAHSSPPQPGEDALGGAILNLGGSVALTNCVLTNCLVQGGAGGQAGAIVAPGGRGAGAAIYNSGGRLTLTNCHLAGNIAIGGAGHADPITLLLSAQRGSGAGGAIFSEAGECQIDGTVFSSNGALGGTAAASASRAGHAMAGALVVRGGRLQMSLSEFRNNYAWGAAATNGQAAGDAHGGALLVETNGIATVDQSVFEQNSARGGDSAVTNTLGTARGGAIFSAGSLQLRKSTLDQNTATAGSALAETNLVSGAAFGGAIASLGSLAIDSSTLSYNTSQGSLGQGGGVFGQGGALFSTNSTYAFNSASTAGGAILLLTNSGFMMNVTVAHNSAGGIAHQNSSFRLRNSIVSSNEPANFTGLVIDDGYNLSSDSSVLLLGIGSTNNIDPRLAPLATNGGPTRTMALLPNSPARDFIPPNLSPPLDQRGSARTANTRGDAGAFEIAADEAPPLIVTMPSGGTVRYGSNFTFQVVAVGASLSYHWLSNGFPILAATNNLLALTNIQVAEPFIDYHAVVSNRFGIVTSLVARLNIDAKPRIDVEPSDILVAPGNPATFSITASGPALTYRWFHDGAELPGATNRVLLFTNSTPEIRGAYFVIATNFSGAATSRVARLAFNSLALSILLPPTNQVVFEGQPVSFNVLVSGVPPFGYAWYFGNTLLPGATNQQLLLPGVALADAAANYRVVVTNAYLAITSAPVSLTVLFQPSLFISFDGTNVQITSRGTPNRPHNLIQSSSISPAEWVVTATNTPAASGTSLWTRPFLNTQNQFFRIVMP
jgi:cyclophilin family peptidyl-prolyl cis-trans isomerase